LRRFSRSIFRKSGSRFSVRKCDTAKVEPPVTIHPLRIDAPRTAPDRPPATPAASDEALIMRIAGGDKLAMRALFARHHVSVYRYALRFSRDRQLAEDLVSEVFLAVWRHAALFEARSAASTWLLAIARFKALSFLRRRGEAPMDDATAAAVADTADDPELTIRKKQQGELLRDCLARLSPDHREIVDLVYYQGMGIAAVAAIVGIPQNTVKTRMFHARKQLSVLLRAAGVDRSRP
jgi:RNA polymerase sigma-70 factor (ECF subfamily)